MPFPPLKIKPNPLPTTENQRGSGVVLAVGEDAADAAAGGGVVAGTAGNEVDVAVEDGLAGV